VSFRRIVIGVDFSASSLAAVRWTAHEFAPRAHLHFVYVAPDPRGSPLLRPYLPESADPFRDVHDIYRALRGLANTIGADRVDVDIVEGTPAGALASIVEDVDADLVCVGKSHCRRASGRFGGTTSHRLLAHTTVPVLAVPESARTRPSAVLAAMSDGGESSHVLHTAARIATAHAAHLDVLHALEAEVQEPAAIAQRFRCHTRLSTIAQNWPCAQVKRLPLGRPSTTTLTPLGDAGEEILAHAARGHIGLVVAGRCRQGDASPPALGSSTRLLLWAAPCPVLILGANGVERRIPPPEPARSFTVITGGDAA